MFEFFFIFSQVKNIKSATIAKVIPTANNGSSEMVTLHRYMVMYALPNLMDF